MTDLSERVRGILILLAITAGPTAAQQRPCDPPTPLGPSHDLYCIELVAAPGIAGVSGRVELAHPPGPFTVAVTSDGRSRYIPIVLLEASRPHRRWPSRRPPPTSLGSRHPRWTR